MPRISAAFVGVTYAMPSIVILPLRLLVRAAMYSSMEVFDTKAGHEMPATAETPHIGAIVPEERGRLVEAEPV